MAITDSIDTLHFAYAEPPAPATYNAPEGFVRPEGISTLIVDSIAADTIHGRVPHFLPVREADSLRAEALADSFPAIPVRPVPSGVREGVAPLALAPDGGGTALSSLMMGVLFLCAVNAKGLARAVSNYKAELWSVRRRPNVFDDETSVRLPMVILLGFVFIIFGGITLYNLPSRPETPSFFGVLASMGLVGAYYLFQICAYSLVGYTFADEEQGRRWIGGFYASQAFAALFMALPAIVSVTCPQWCHPLTIVSLSTYLISHLLFIIKGFRIFFHKIGSSLYFILYLCTLEIIPAVTLYKISIFLTETIR